MLIHLFHFEFKIKLCKKLNYFFLRLVYVYYYINFQTSSNYATQNHNRNTC